MYGRAVRCKRFWSTLDATTLFGAGPHKRPANLERHVRVCSVLDHAARHEASDVDGITLKFWGHRPDHRPARPVRLGDNGIIWHIDPLAIETDAIMPVLRFPVGIGYG